MVVILRRFLAPGHMEEKPPSGGVCEGTSKRMANDQRGPVGGSRSYRGVPCLAVNSQRFYEFP